MDINHYIVSADEILPGLWLGNEATSQNEEFMKKHNIAVIVNASRDIPSKFLGNIYYIRVPVDDPGYVRGDDKNVKIMRKSLPLVLEIIKRALLRGINVLVHCHAGAQRSAIIVAMFLLKNGHARSSDHAVELVVQKRPIAFFGGDSVNFHAVFD
jgi:protein tyrosine/serine phosphatase